MGHLNIYKHTGIYKERSFWGELNGFLDRHILLNIPCIFFTSRHFSSSQWQNKNSVRGQEVSMQLSPGKNISYSKHNYLGGKVKGSH